MAWNFTSCIIFFNFIHPIIFKCTDLRNLHSWVSITVFTREVWKKMQECLAGFDDKIGLPLLIITWGYNPPWNRLLATLSRWILLFLCMPWTWYAYTCILSNLQPFSEPQLRSYDSISSMKRGPHSSMLFPSQGGWEVFSITTHPQKAAPALTPPPPFQPSRSQLKIFPTQFVLVIFHCIIIIIVILY